MKVIKKGKLIILFLIVLFLTGCARYEGDLKIRKDKSANLTLFIGVEKSYLNEQKYNIEKDLKRLESKGFKIDEYEKDNYKGYKIIYKINNIDSVSTKDSVRVNLINMFDEGFDFKFFKVEKAFLKNKYFAKFKIDSSDANYKYYDLINGNDLIDIEPTMNPSDGSKNTNEEKTNNKKKSSPSESNDKESKSNSSSASSSSSSSVDRTPSKGEVERESFIPDNFKVLKLSRKNIRPEIEDGYSSYNPIDVKFNVELPYSAIENNATYSKEDDKKLEWITVNDDTVYINFEFELYNFRKMFFIVIFIILIIIFIIKYFRNKKSLRKQIEKEIRKQRKKGNLTYKNNANMDVSSKEVLSVMFRGLIKIIKNILSSLSNIYHRLFSNSYINEEEVLRKIENDSKLRKSTTKINNKNSKNNSKNNYSKNGKKYNNKNKQNRKNNSKTKKDNKNNSKKASKFDKYFDDEII